MVLASLESLLRRLAALPFVSVAAINGHAYGGGLMLAMAHDYRVMLASRGWVCVPAVRLNIQLPAVLVELIRYVLVLAPAALRYARALTAAQLQGGAACGACDSARGQALRWPRGARGPRGGWRRRDAARAAAAGDRDGGSARARDRHGAQPRHGAAHQAAAVRQAVARTPACSSTRDIERDAHTQRGSNRTTARLRLGRHCFDWAVRVHHTRSNSRRAHWTRVRYRERGEPRNPRRTHVDVRSQDRRDRVARENEPTSSIKFELARERGREREQEECYKSAASSMLTRASTMVGITALAPLALAVRQTKGMTLYLATLTRSIV